MRLQQRQWRQIENTALLDGANVGLLLSFAAGWGGLVLGLWLLHPCPKQGLEGKCGQAHTVF